MLSSTPVTVIVWALFQFELVKVKEPAETVASPVSPEDTPITTSEDGWASKTTVNESVEPDSLTAVELLDSTTVKPQGSAVAAVTVWSLKESKLLSELPSLTAKVIVVFWEPSTALSATPVTVTVWAEFQLPVVNVREEGKTVASSVSPEDTSITTFELGAWVKTTVNVSVVPVSETETFVLDFEKPGESLSAVAAVTVWSLKESKLLSELPSLTLKVIVVFWEPSILASSIPVTVTVWALFQLPVVNVREALSTVASSVSSEVTLITTFELGWASNTTVNVSVVPVSETVTAVLDLVKPAESLSAVATVTVWSAKGS